MAWMTNKNNRIGANNVRIVVPSDTPETWASDLGKGRPTIIKPYSSMGAKMIPQRTCQPALGRPRLGSWFRPRLTRAPSTRPPGQPACRMFNQCVLLCGNKVAVNGLMTASQVPLPNEKNQAPAHKHQNAPSLP